MNTDKVLKWIIVLLMTLGFILAIMNFLSVDSNAFVSGAGSEADGTMQADGCYGPALNCLNNGSGSFAPAKKQWNPPLKKKSTKKTHPQQQKKTKKVKSKKK